MYDIGTENHISITGRPYVLLDIELEGIKKAFLRSMLPPLANIIKTLFQFGRLPANSRQVCGHISGMLASATTHFKDEGVIRRILTKYVQYRALISNARFSYGELGDPWFIIQK